SLELPRDKLIVFTGLSGSGKSSLAFDTIYAEGQRRYVESLSAYARQFLGQMDKPDVDFIEGLSPAISIDQKTASRNPRSTVGTVTEIHDYLRLLWARIGVPHCPTHGLPVKRQTPQQIVDQVLQLREGTRFQVLAPVVRGRKGEYETLLKDIASQGFARAKVDGELRELTEQIRLDRYFQHSIEVVVDRLVLKEGINQRLTESLETALRLADGVVEIAGIDGPTHTFSQHLACPEGDFSADDLQPRNFSFNSPYCACPECSGIGTRFEVDPDLVVPDSERTIREGALAPWASMTADYHKRLLEGLSIEMGSSRDTPYAKLPKKVRETLLYGMSGKKVQVTYTNRYGRKRVYQAEYEGAIPFLNRRHGTADSDSAREWYQEFMREVPCSVCGGARLNPASRAVTIAKKNIHQVSIMSVGEVSQWAENLTLSERDEQIAARVLKEVRTRLQFLVDVGLDYLTLARSAATLAGGEAQRIRLATQIGSGLVGVLYILDEPSIGLHQRDNQKLMETLIRLRNLGNTLIVVEHDEDTIRIADHIVDIGPGAGEHGGEIIAEGGIEDITAAPASITGDYLAGRRQIEMPLMRRTSNGKSITVVGAKQHNLKDLTVEFPLGLFTCVTGVSGSGKSTLVQDILSEALHQKIYRSRAVPGRHTRVNGVQNIDKVINIDQSPIGRTPRSNPATYTKVFDQIRTLFASTPEARARGYLPGRFSFNVKGGRCEACAGDGNIKIEMHFLPDVYVPCEVCRGARYNRETLEIHWKGHSIAEVLEMSVEEAIVVFANQPRIMRVLQTLFDVGLGYIRLGQAATTLSGGEAQRIKLASELGRRSTGRTFYILDEPTTGLHFEDIRKLLQVLQRLVNSGNTVVVIEHNLDVIKSADWVIDLGPEGGGGGGWVVAEGTPEDVADVSESYTGKFLRELIRSN
ncbi:MAG: excinuclease ABC subunit UvrA, partial [Acidimicrobiia bacterium]